MSENNIIKARDVKIVKRRSGDPQRDSASANKSTAGGNAQLPRGGQKGRGDYLSLIANVKREAYDKGFAKGVEFRKKEMLSALDAISLALKEIKNLEKDFYVDIEEKMLNLALCVARKVINMEVSANREVVLAVLREAVKKISEVNGLKILLNPDDLSFIMEMKPDIFRENNLLKDAVFEGSSMVERGGVLLETDNFEVDARLQQQFGIIEEALKNR